MAPDIQTIHYFTYVYNWSFTLYHVVGRPWKVNMASSENVSPLCSQIKFFFLKSSYLFKYVFSYVVFCRIKYVIYSVQYVIYSNARLVFCVVFKDMENISLILLKYLS